MPEEALTSFTVCNAGRSGIVTGIKKVDNTENISYQWIIL